MIAVVLGAYQAADHANEWMKQSVLIRLVPVSGVLPVAVCPEDELEEENLSTAECEQLVTRVETHAQTTPALFVRAQMALSIAGAAVALGWLVIGIALTGGRTWAPAAAITVFAASLILETGGFVAALNAGPITREIYLWPALLWILIHIMLLTAAALGWRGGWRTPEQADPFTPMRPCNRPRSTNRLVARR